MWVPVALDAGDAAHAQLAAQLAVYLAPPGYGEMFSALGFDDLVMKARSGATRRELAAAIPVELLDSVCALGSAARIAARLNAYREAGADCIAVVPSTAEDPGGRATLCTQSGGSAIMTPTNTVCRLASPPGRSAQHLRLADRR